MRALDEILAALSKTAAALALSPFTVPFANSPEDALPPNIMERLEKSALDRVGMTPSSHGQTEDIFSWG